MTMRDLGLLAVTIDELVEQVIGIKYVLSIEVKDNKLIIYYSDRTSSTYPISTHQLHLQEAVIDEQELCQRIMDLLKKGIELHLAQVSKSMIDEILPQVKGEPGSDGADADEQKIIETITQKLQSNLETELLKIKSTMLIPKDGLDGRDADEAAIEANLLKIVNANLSQVHEEIKSELQANLEVIRSKIPVPKDGKDGKDADETAIIDKLVIRLNNLVTETNIKLKQELLEVISKRIQEIQDSFKPLKGEKGEDGRDGRDADEAKIASSILSKVTDKINSELSKYKSAVKKEITHGLNVIKESIPEVRDGKDGKDGRDGKNGQSIKGDKGDKGDRGNGIVSAEINSRDHLIIKTDDKEIDAGKVGVKNFFGGGGADISYTNTLPMPVKVGNLPKGTQFKNTDLRTLFTRLFYGYEFPVFSQFAIGDLRESVEVGYKTLAASYPATFEITNPELLEQNTITIKKDGTLLLEGLANISPIEVLLLEEVRDTLSSINFEIMAYDTTGVSFNKYFNINYKYRIYYGEYTEDIEDTGLSNPLSVLRATELVDDIKSEYLFLGVGYKWFCYPEALGEHYTFFEVTSDIALVFADLKKISITNEYGLNLTYNCYRTEHEINEEFVMGIKNG